MTVTNYYVTSDAMGSVTAILDEDGNTLERRSYEAFGEMTCMLPDGSPVVITPTGVDFGFQGQFRDDVTGLYQMGYRWYLTLLGRWLSRDLVGLDGGLNSYASFGNSPSIYVDKFGLQEQSLSVSFTYDDSSVLRFRISVALDASSRVNRNIAISRGAYLSFYNTQQGNLPSRCFSDCGLDVGAFFRADVGCGNSSWAKMHPLNAYTTSAVSVPFTNSLSKGYTLNFNKHVGPTLIGTASVEVGNFSAYYANDAALLPSFVPRHLSSDKSWTGTGGVAVRSGDNQYGLSYMAFTSEGRGRDDSIAYGSSPAGYYKASNSLNSNGWRLAAERKGFEVSLFIPANEYWNVQQRLHDSFWYSANGELLPQNPLDPMPLRFFFGNSLRPELTIGASLR
jgi:RHS repeat-associated protein